MSRFDVYTGFDVHPNAIDVSKKPVQKADGPIFNPGPVNDEIKNAGRNLGTLIEKKTVYHGSGTAGIKEFEIADEDTVGSGAYFTSDEEAAKGYARRRSNCGKTPEKILYEAVIENLNMIDLRDQKTLDTIFDGFAEALKEKVDFSKHFSAYLFKRNTQTIKDRDYSTGNVRSVTWNYCSWFSEYLKSLGYDGLITVEGGEGTDVGNHDTWLIFDPKKARIIKESPLQESGAPNV